MADEGEQTFVPEEDHSLQQENQCCWINKLPTEVLVKIFEYLPAADLRNAAVVCRRWHEASCERSVRRNKKLVIKKFQTAVHVMELLKKCNWKHINLHFNQVFLRDYGVLFWTNVGNRVYEINFKNCSFHDNEIEHVISICQNLEYLNVTLKGHGRAFKLFSDLFARLFETEMVHEKLLYLDVGFYSDLHINKNLPKDLNQWPPSVFVNIFKLFPNLRSFKLNLPFLTANDRVEDMYPFLPRDFTLPDFVKRFKLEFCQGAPCKLKSVYIQSHDDMTLTPVTHFFSQHNGVENFTYNTVCDEPENGFSIALLKVALHLCSELRHVKLGYYCDVNKTCELDNEVFEELLTRPRLETFSILSTTRLTLGGTMLKQKNLTANRTLRRLILGNHRQYDPVVIEKFVKLFCNLYCLKLLWGTPATAHLLDAIWKYQVNLKKLVINVCGYMVDECTVYDEDRPRTVLQGLTHLDICLHRTPKLDDFTAYPVEFEPPVKTCAVFKLFVELPDRAPWLEYLVCCVRTISFHLFLEVISRLQRLRVLHMREANHFFKNNGGRKMYTEIFNRCPSLREIHCSFLEDNWPDDHYYYDITAQDVAEVNAN